uniref:Ovule protein n=1 Tax=Caenorhabditis tropicalis TaxID=1561998 RepID=A0A1I7TA62_9PELO
MSSAGNTSSIDSGFFPMTSQERPENDYTIQDLSFSSAATWRHASSSTTGIRNDLVINSNFFWLNTPAATTTSTGSTTPPQAAEEDAHKTQQTPVTVVPPGSSVMYTPESPEDPFPLPSNQHDIHVERLKPRQRTSKIEPYPTRKVWKPLLPRHPHHLNPLRKNNLPSQKPSQKHKDLKK